MAHGKKIVIATVNINGLPSSYHHAGVTKELLPYPLRHEAICQWFENSDVDIINLQEVFTYRNLRLLKRNLPSYKYVSFAPFLFGPRGALVTFSKLPLSRTAYQSFFSTTMQVNRSNLPKLSLLRSTLKGVLVLKARTLPLTIINTHLLYNADMDWGPGGRFYDIHEAQLDKVACAVKNQSALGAANIVVAGDFNVEANSELIHEFIDKTNLHDLFEGDDKPSFHEEYMPEVKFRHRIDYLLTNNENLAASKPHRIFTQKIQLNDGRNVHVSDHHGLVATINLVSRA